LTRLVDNLLAFSRVTDTAAVQSFEPIAVDVLVAMRCSASTGSCVKPDLMCQSTCHEAFRRFSATHRR
jgi:hypothetical protein